MATNNFDAFPNFNEDFFILVGKVTNKIAIPPLFENRFD